MEQLGVDYDQKQKEVDETGARIRAANEDAETYRAKMAEIKRDMNHHENKIKDLRKRRDVVTLRIKKLQDFIEQVQEQALRDTQYYYLLSHMQQWGSH